MGRLNQTIGQGRLAVIDVGDDAKVSICLHVCNCNRLTHTYIAGIVSEINKKDI